MPAAPQAFSPAAPDTAVRKTVTVLFADLGGSTSFGERTDAELARVVMARYHATLQEVIDAHGGTVAKFMGDGMMATFGIPEIAEDDAVRAVQAGAELQQRFSAFATEVADRHGEILTLRVGINTGEVVIADGDADLIGDALNVAARLEKACRPGQVLVGEETWRITRGEFGFEGLGEVSVAGRAAPVGIYELAPADAITAEPVAPFVGRALEMQRLQSAFERAASSCTALLVTVLGSPGLGKTRLSRELASRVTGESDAAAFEIRCDREGEATFAPIAQLIREAAGIGDDTETDATAARERIAELFAADDADRERLVDVLAGVFGAAPARSVEETFWSIRRLVESLAATRPIVIVIDDIQWAEPKLLDLLEHLAEWVNGAAVLLVCLARPELREVRPALAETSRRVTDVLALDGLDSAATEQLAAGLLGTERLPAGLIERLPASTDGNPLFVRELVRMLVDDEVIRRRDDGVWELTIDADAVEVPPTIQSLLAARVERLPIEERRLLELASVIGAEFSLGALRELAGVAISVPSLLESMRRKELVEPTGTYWVDEPVHRFHHVLIRDAAYRRLLKTTRADLHERVGEWTDASAANLIGEHEAAIAFHYEQAYAYRRELGSIDKRLGRRAAQLLSIAAQRALGRDDLASAGTLARRAVALVPDDDATRSELLLIACECFLASGDVAAGTPLVRELTEIAAGDEQLAAWAACFEAQLVGLIDPQGLLAADATATAAAETLQALGDGAGEAKAHQVRAGLLARLGHVGDAEAVLELALGAARAANDRRRVTAVLGAAPLAALFGPSPVARAGGRCLDVVRLLRITTASPSVEATSMRCQAVLEALRGRFEVARSMLASARESLVELGLPHGLLETELFTGMVELLADNPGAAIAPSRAAYEGLGTLGVGADAGQAAALLARALLQQGDVDDADRMAAASEELAGQNLKTAIAWRVARAEVLAARGDLTAALAIGDEAVEIAAATDLILDHADACVAVMRLREAAGDETGARAARDEALRLYRAKGASVPAQRLGSTPEDESPAVSTAAVAKPSDRSTDARSPYAENASATMLERLWSLIIAGQHEEFGSLCPDDVAYIDRRSLVAVDVYGRDNLLSNNRALEQLGLDFAGVEVLAVRGSKLSLARITARFGNSSELMAFQVLELDDDGLASRHVFFDEDNLDAAIDELDERFLAGEGAEHADVYRASVESMRMHRALDWEAVRESLTDDFVLVDHRELGVGECDRDGFIEFASAGAPEQQELTVIVRTLHHVGQSTLASFRSSITRAGTAYEWLFHGLMAVDASGRVERMEWFADDDFDLALARLDELGAPDPTRPAYLDNTVLRSIMVGGIADAAGFADDLVLDDRRSGVSLPQLHGSAEAVRASRVQEELFGPTAMEPVATRGDRLALVRTRSTAESGFELVAYGIFETDEEGLISAMVFFDESDLASAHTELDARFFAGEGAPHADALQVAWTMAVVDSQQDFDALRFLLSPDFIGVDHQILGFGSGDRDWYVEAARTRTQVAADAASTLLSLDVATNSLVFTLLSRSITDQGSEYERLECYLVVVDEARRISRIELFPPERYAEALARLHELAAVPLNPPHASVAIDNRVVRLVTKLVEFLDRGDYTAARELDAVADAIVRVDRRRGVSAPPLRGADAFGLNAAAFFDVFETVTCEPVAVRGESLTLIRLHCGQADGFQLLLLCLYECDTNGRLVYEADYDDEDLAAALDELDERYIAGEGAEHEYMIRRLDDHRHAFAARAWDAYEALLHPEFAFVDHRQIGQGSGNRDGMLTSLRALAGLVSDFSYVEPSLLINDDVALTRVRDRATNAEGNEYEWEHFVIQQFVAGLVRCAELFPLDAYADARARFDALANESRTPHLDNTAMRVMARSNWRGLFEPDYDRLSSYRPDCVLVDRRRNVNAGELAGREDVAGSIQSGIDVFGALVTEPIAVRGEQLLLATWRFEQEGGFNAGGLTVLEVDELGRILAIISFDEEDLASAVAELESRHRALSGDAYSVADEFLVACETGIVRLAPDVAARLATLCAKSYVSGNVVLSVWPHDSSYCVIVLDDEGHATTCEFFDEHHWNDALVLFDELSES
jgi:class 3 adenylate cyclase/tetratricopeptide (TPR) repeat protein